MRSSIFFQFDYIELNHGAVAVRPAAALVQHGIDGGINVALGPCEAGGEILLLGLIFAENVVERAFGGGVIEIAPAALVARASENRLKALLLQRVLIIAEDFERRAFGRGAIGDAGDAAFERQRSLGIFRAPAVILRGRGQQPVIGEILRLVADNLRAFIARHQRVIAAALDILGEGCGSGCQKDASCNRDPHDVLPGMVRDSSRLTP
jgi:hypothetical protein